MQSRRSGKFVYYGLSDEGVEKVLQEVEALLMKVGAAVEACPILEGPAQPASVSYIPEYAPLDGDSL